MTKHIFILLAFVCCTSILCEAAGAPSSDVHALLQHAVAGGWRSDANKTRDQYRHPIETLEFFGLRPDMTVVELTPGGGWYTEILAPVLRDGGQLIAATEDLNGEYAKKLSAGPEVFGRVSLLKFSPPDPVKLGADGSADMVLTFRNLHDWLNDSAAELESVFQAAFDVLKPGGTFGIEEHRARPYMDAEQSSKKLHRIPRAMSSRLVSRPVSCWLVSRKLTPIPRMTRPSTCIPYCRSWQGTMKVSSLSVRATA